MYRFKRLVFGLFICLQVSLVLNPVSGQVLPLKYATLELFTNTPCPICASQNPGLFNRLDSYEGKYHLISFYPGIPYSSCIFFKANMTENQTRKNYYSQIFGTPTVAINGTQFKNSSGVTNAVLDGITGGQTWLEVRVDETIGTSTSVNITLEDHVGGSIATGRLFAVIVEREIMYNAPNGETLHHNVFRKFLTDVNGEDVDMSSGTATKTYQYTLDPAWQADQVYVIAWLANPNTKEVYNSGTRFDQSLSATSDIMKRNIDVYPYPNPAGDHVLVKLPEDVAGEVNVKILSPSGRVVRNIEGLQVTALPLHITLNELPSALYYIIIEGKDRSYMGRVVVE